MLDWRCVLSIEPPTFPSQLYPAFAPLPAPMADHLLLEESRRYSRRRPSRRPGHAEMVQAVLERISRARVIVYEYLNPFVLADRKRQERNESRTFPTSEWVLETLAHYTPNQWNYDEKTLQSWQQRGLLRREKARGLFDVGSLAALFVQRLAEGTHQRNWLASSLEEDEPWWWCYGRSSPGEPLQAIPVPIPSGLPPTMVLWTAWQGASWDGQWQRCEGRALLCRWAGYPGIEDMLVWEEELPRKILALQKDAFFGRPSIQEVVVQEARQEVLLRLSQKGLEDVAIQ